MVGSKQEQDLCRFAIVQATIEKVDDRMVTFSARSAGDGDVDQNLRRSFTVPREEIYTQPIPGGPPPVALRPGSTGNLYLSRTGWATTSVDGYALFGGSTAIFKWPICAGVAAPMVSRLRVLPSSIVVRGHLEGQTAFFEIDLLGPDAATSQDMTWNGVDLIDVALAPGGVQRLGARAAMVKVWPTRLVVKGSPEFDPSLCGEIDLLDAELARGPQRLAFASKGGAVTLALTQDGVAVFHLTPQLLADLGPGRETDACA